MDIIVSNLCKSYDGKAVLTDFNATFPTGKTTCLLGRSGCGKTTLLHILMGLVKADSGEISGIPRKISAVFQENRLCTGLSVGRNAALACPGRLSPLEIIAHLEEVGLAGKELLHRPIDTLSGGMQRRIAIIRAVLAEGDLLLLDEPFQGLDPRTRLQTMAYLQAHTRNKTLIMVTHSREEAELMGGSYIEMQ